MEAKQEGNVTCLQEIYKNTCDGASAITTVLPRVENEMLQKDLEQELHELRRIQMNAGRALGNLGEKVKGPNPIQSAGMKLGTSLRTMLNSNSGYIAQLMIHGNELGINELKRTMDTYPDIDDEVKTIAVELLQLEIDSQNMMKKYLNQAE